MMTGAAARGVAEDERAARVAVRAYSVRRWVGGPIYLSERQAADRVGSSRFDG
jgi:hypothetical protein